MFFFLLFASCEKTIEISDPSFDPMLVIVSNIAPHYTNTPDDNRIRVEISESQEPADNKDFNYPNDVRVYITKRNVEDREELKKANTVNYFSSQKDIAVPDEKYSIQVVAQGYDTITAETYIPAGKRCEKTTRYWILKKTHLLKMMKRSISHTT